MNERKEIITYLGGYEAFLKEQIEKGKNGFIEKFDAFSKDKEKNIGIFIMACPEKPIFADVNNFEPFFAENIGGLYNPNSRPSRIERTSNGIHYNNEGSTEKDFQGHFGYNGFIQYSFLHREIYINWVLALIAHTICNIERLRKLSKTNPNYFIYICLHTKGRCSLSVDPRSYSAFLKDLPEGNLELPLYFLQEAKSFDKFFRFIIKSIFSLRYNGKISDGAVDENAVDFSELLANES